VSNVLIGIIGVILFIGLAIAGASFLGPRFSQSTNMSKAASVVSSMDQMANAAKMRKASVGATGPSGSPNYLVTEGYLKSVPANILDNVSSYFDFRDANGYYTGSAAYALAGLNAGKQDHVGVCKEINRQTGVGGADGTPPSAAAPVGRMGCFISNGWAGGSLNGIMIVYRKL
jgi:hypothetical protein